MTPRRTALPSCPVYPGRNDLDLSMLRSGRSDSPSTRSRSRTNYRGRIFCTCWLSLPLRSRRADSLKKTRVPWTQQNTIYTISDARMISVIYSAGSSIKKRFRRHPCFFQGMKSAAYGADTCFVSAAPSRSKLSLNLRLKPASILQRFLTDHQTPYCLSEVRFKHRTSTAFTYISSPERKRNTPLV